jgi:hypothetical protein
MLTGEDVVALEVAPDPPELASGLHGLRPRRDECGVERAGRCADEQVGADAVLPERPEHPRLSGGETRTTGENERRA